jgi:penicillin amidase
LQRPSSDGRGLIALALAVAVAAGCIHHRQEPWAGPDALKAPGELPSAPVEIFEDAWGIPHIRAASVQDGFYALARLHVEERLWQMELNRRIGHGRLSEIFGKRTVGTDRLLRTLGLGRAARSALEQLEAKDRALIDAYVAGVNDGIEGLEQRPPEFRILGIHPEPWTAVDSMVWTKVMALRLGGDAWTEALVAAIDAELGPEVSEVFVPVEAEDTLRILPADQMLELRGRSIGGVGSAPSSAGETPPQPQPPADPGGPPAPPQDPGWGDAVDDALNLLGAGPGVGSNNWVIAPQRTADRGAILANDPHLGVQMPSIWYMAEIDSPGYHAVGATFPGLPGIVIGHNEHIAWGLTNVGPDVMDLFVEEPHPEDPDRVRRGDGWEELQRITETLEIRGRKDEVLELRIGSNGPLVTPFFEGLGAEVAMRWTALEAQDTTAAAIFGLGRATNWEEFLEALRAFVGPSQNVVYADLEGNIGWKVVGRIPIRNGRDGRRPARGWAPEDAWVGTIPFEELPQAFNPAQGYIVTANNASAPSDYPHHIATRFEDPHRAMRIQQRLLARSDWAPAAVQALQLDTVSLQARELLPVLHALEASEEDHRRALGLLRDWDGDMNVDSAAAVIYQAWLVEAIELVARPTLGEELFLRWFRQDAAFLESVFLGEQNLLCRNGGHADCAALALEALDRALDRATKALGKTMEDWRWGELHTIEYRHPLAFSPHLKSRLNARAESPGDRWTVNVGAYDSRSPFAQTWSPSLRVVLTPSDWSTSTVSHAPGQSGVPWRGHYRDLVEGHVDGQALPLIFGADRYEKAAVRVRQLAR